MKKFLVGFLFVALFFGGITAHASSAKNISIYNSINTIEINKRTYNAKQYNVFLYNNTTYVPVRFVSEQLGFDVKWNGSNQSVTIGKGSGSDQASTVQGTTSKPFNQNIDIYHNVKTLIINGVSYDGVSQNAFIYNNSTYVPLRFVSEKLGYGVRWEQNSQSILIGEGVVSDQQSIQQSISVTPAAPDYTNTLAPFENEVIYQVNVIRQSYGLQPYTVNMDLTRVARAKNNDMYTYKYFDHTSPTYGSPSNMAKYFGIKYSAFGENLAKGYTTPTDVVNGWMNSPGHRANILHPNFTEIGVGYLPGGHHWTQLFRRP